MKFNIKTKDYPFYFMSLLIFYFWMYAMFYAAKNYYSFSKTSFLSYNKSLSFKSKIEREKYDVNCKLIFEMDTKEMNKSIELLNSLRAREYNHERLRLVPDVNYIFDSKKCEMYKQIRGFYKYTANDLIDDFEYQFPLAYSILTYNNVEQFERMLLAIYRPHNIYCIHIDNKSNIVFKKAIESIVNCFENVFITTQLLDIVYAGYNRLQADINCMNDILSLTSRTSILYQKIVHRKNFLNKNLNKNWKYLLNYAGSEFPLRTNYELTLILNRYNGSNEIGIIKHINPNFINRTWEVKFNRYNVAYMSPTNHSKSRPPHSYKIVKGLAYWALSRKFVEYATSNQNAQDLLKWSVDTYSPDEWLVFFFYLFFPSSWKILNKFNANLVAFLDLNDFYQLNSR